MSLLENIQYLCKDHNISVPKLEKELGLGNGSIYKWGSSSPTVDKLQKVADYFKVSTEYLLLGYERNFLVSFINSIRGERSIEKFAEATGVDIDELTKICLGLIIERPSLDTIEKIANSTLDFIPQRKLDRGILLRVAGYRTLAKVGEDFKDKPYDKVNTTEPVSNSATQEKGNFFDGLTEDERKAARAFVEAYRKQFK